MSKAADYYNHTAGSYDALHGEEEPEHTRALELGWPMLGPARTALDVGCGTGRSLQWIRDNGGTGVELNGIEPSEGMIAIARGKVPSANIILGSGERLPFDDRSIDVVTATGVMHHADHPALLIAEMFRVARKGILISDHNNYAFGGDVARRLRMGLKLCGLLSVATYIGQGFSKRGYSDGDGWWYPYSLLDNYGQIARAADRMFVFPTRKPVNDGHVLFAQGHLAIVALK